LLETVGLKQFTTVFLYHIMLKSRLCCILRCASPGNHSLQYFLRNARMHSHLIHHFPVHRPNVQRKCLARIHWSFSCFPSIAPPRSSRGHLPLLDIWSGLALVRHNRVHHDLIWVLWVVGRVSLAPVVADSICKDIPSMVERCS